MRGTALPELIRSFSPKDWMDPEQPEQGPGSFEGMKPLPMEPSCQHKESECLHDSVLALEGVKELPQPLEFRAEVEHSVVGRRLKD